MKPLEMLSEQQRKVLEFVLTHHIVIGRPANFTDIARHIHTGNTRAHQHIRRLQEHGWVDVGITSKANMSTRARKAQLTETAFTALAESFVSREKLPGVVSDTERELEFRTTDIVTDAFKAGHGVRKDGKDLVVGRSQGGDPQKRYALGPIDPS